jgi:hypothetical protein
LHGKKFRYSPENIPGDRTIESMRKALHAKGLRKRLDEDMGLALTAIGKTKISELHPIQKRQIVDIFLRASKKKKLKVVK